MEIRCETCNAYIDEYCSGEVPVCAWCKYKEHATEKYPCVDCSGIEENSSTCRFEIEEDN